MMENVRKTCHDQRARLLKAQDQFQSVNSNFALNDDRQDANSLYAFNAAVDKSMITPTDTMAANRKSTHVIREVLEEDDPDKDITFEQQRNRFS